MDDNKYKQDMASFMEEHPELEPAWEPVLAPVIQGSEDSLRAFILSYLFM